MIQLTVLGASGFLGRALLDAARARGIGARAVTRDARAAFAPDVPAVRVDDYLSAPAPRGPGEALVHLAQSNLVGAAQDGLVATTLVERLAGLGYDYFCYASSAAVYGDRDAHPHRADETIGNPGPYAQLKLNCESRVLAVGGGAARFTNLYGPGQSQASVLARVLSQIPGRGALRLRSLSPVRDFCWVVDGANALLDACIARLRGAFNVGAGQSISIGELARRALDVAGEAGRPVEAEEAGNFSELRVDIAATTAACGWRPTVDLETGLRNMMGDRR